MADFAKWVVAAEPELPWKDVKFMDIYNQNREEASQSCFESDIVAIALKDFIEATGSFQGTATELKASLERFVNETRQDIDIKDRSWSKRPNHLSNRIKRIAPSLRKIGIAVDTPKINGRKLWRFELKEEEGVDE